MLQTSKVTQPIRLFDSEMSS